MSLSENQKKRVEEILKARIHNEWDGFEEARFRDYSDDDSEGTVTKAVIKSHRNTVNTEAFSDIGILQVEKLEDYKWAIHLSPVGVKEVIEDE